MLEIIFLRLKMYNYFFFFFLPAGRMKIEIDAPAKGIHIVPNKDCHSSFETVPGKQRIVNCV